MPPEKWDFYGQKDKQNVGWHCHRCLSNSVCTWRWWLGGKSVPSHFSVTISGTCGTNMGSTHNSSSLHIWRDFIFYERKWNVTNSQVSEKRNGIFQQKADNALKIIKVEKTSKINKPSLEPGTTTPTKPYCRVPGLLTSQTLPKMMTPTLPWGSFSNV